MMDSEDKNNDFEKILVSLKHDKDKILKENQEKDREIQKLKDFLSKKEKETSKKKSNNSSDSFHDEEEVPIRALSNINPDPIVAPPNPQHKKSNSTVTTSISKKPTPISVLQNPTPPPPQKSPKETKNIDFKPTNPLPPAKNKVLLDSPETQRAKEKVQVHSFNSVASLPEKKEKEINNNKTTNVKDLSVMQSNNALPDPNPISKKTAMLKSESNNTLVKLISIMEKKGSIKNIKTENKRRTSIIENMPSVNTPYEVFKSLIIPNFSVVKKKIIMENEVLLFEFRTLINENKERIFRIEGYNLETAKAMKTAIMKDDVLKKVLDSINYEDILPLTHPLKSIFKYLDFVKHFIMPFIGVDSIV